MQHKIVITRHRPWFKTGLIGGGAFLILVLAWGLYSYTRATTVSDFARAQTEVERLQDERRRLIQELRASRTEAENLRNQLAYEKRSVQIDAHACDEVRQSLTGLQTEASNLREQLAFYRGIASPAQARAGVRVYEFKLHPKEKSVFSYDLTLIQAVRQDRFFGGMARIEIQGLQNGVRQTLPLDELAGGDGKKLIFSMKYFQELRGDFRLPEGFKPQRAVVTLQIDGDNAPRVEEAFEWNRIVVPGGNNEHVRQ
jgi:signal transduction histidine kinase